jgi:hypothetical protein
MFLKDGKFIEKLGTWIMKQLSNGVIRQLQVAEKK